MDNTNNMSLSDFFKENRKVAIAFSGGVDSAYLLYFAKCCKADVIAYFVKSQFQPQFEYEDVIKFAKKYDIKLKIIDVDVLANEAVKRNDALRCYYCKQTIFSSIQKIAKIDGYDLILDGTNASDDENERPGMKALKEMGIKSPLRICGLTKDEIRNLSKKAGLTTWNMPSYSCLATRVHVNEAITENTLKKIEECENYLASLGFSNYRVRVSNNNACVEIHKYQIPRFEQFEKTIFSEFEKYFNEIKWGERFGNIIGNSKGK